MVHAILKVIAGIFIVPLAIVVGLVWQWWEQKTGVLHWVLAPIIAPIGMIVLQISKWYEDF